MGRCAGELIGRDSRDPEGHFLAGLAERGVRRPRQATEYFHRALALDADRHDAALELASLYSVSGRHQEAFELLERYTPRLHDSPRYLDIAGLAYSAIGLPERAWPLHHLGPTHCSRGCRNSWPTLRHAASRWAVSMKAARCT